MDPSLDMREPVDQRELAERRKATYIEVPDPGRRLALAAWLAALAIVLAAAGVAGLGLLVLRYEYFVMEDGGYVLRMNRLTGDICYIPADPEWERNLVGRQSLLNRCGL